MGLSNVSLPNEANKKICFTTYEVLKIVKSGYVIYTQSNFRSEKQRELDMEKEISPVATYTGEMNAQSKRRLMKIFYLWSDSIDMYNLKMKEMKMSSFKKLVFITLTLCCTQFHADAQIKVNCLKPFLRVLREKYNCQNYVWKAETQANGNIHFHLIVDTYIQKELVSDAWNNAIENLGYVSEFEKKYGHRNPPSARIEAVRKMDNIDRYCAKYLCKESNYRKIEGALWKASVPLYQLRETSVEIDHIQQDLLINAISSGKIEAIQC